MLTLSPETEALIRAKARTAGKTPEQVICDALGFTLTPPPRATRTKASLADLLAIADQAANRPLLDPRTADEIIGYNAFGLPE